MNKKKLTDYMHYHRRSLVKVDVVETVQNGLSRKQYLRKPVECVY